MTSGNLIAHYSGGKDHSGDYIAIISAKWHAEITGAMSLGARQTLVEAGIPSEQIQVYDVPGSYELPQAANWIAQLGRYDAIICIGCVIKGETSHNEYINHTVANKLADIALSYSIPVIFGVLTPNDYQQAADRAGGKLGNKGSEAAVAALEMLDLQASLPFESEQETES